LECLFQQENKTTANSVYNQLLYVPVRAYKVSFPTNRIGPSKLINYLRNADKGSLSDVFFGKIPNMESLNHALDKISKNITKVQAIPINKRHFDF
jgi:hypothetical protein